MALSPRAPPFVPRTWSLPHAVVMLQGAVPVGRRDREALVRQFSAAFGEAHGVWDKGAPYSIHVPVEAYGSAGGAFRAMQDTVGRRAPAGAPHRAHRLVFIPSDLPNCMFGTVVPRVCIPIKSNLLCRAVPPHHS
jgi:hypothetical protein